MKVRSARFDHHRLGLLASGWALILSLAIGGLAPGLETLASPVSSPRAGADEAMPCCRGAEAMPCCAPVDRVEASCSCRLSGQTSPPAGRRLAAAVVDQAAARPASVPAAPVCASKPEPVECTRNRGLALVDRPTFLSSLLC